MKKGTLTSPSSFYVRSVLHAKGASEDGGDMPEPETLVDPVSVDRLKSALESALREEMELRGKKQSSRPPPVVGQVSAPAVPQAPPVLKVGLPTALPANRFPQRRAHAVSPAVQAAIAATIAIGAAIFILIGAH